MPRYDSDGYDGCYTVDMPTHAESTESYFVADMLRFPGSEHLTVTQFIEDAHRFDNLAVAQGIADLMNRDDFWRREDREWQPSYRLLEPQVQEADMSELTPGVIR